MTFNTINRFLFIIRIILNYGLIEFVPKYRLILPLRIKNRYLLRFFNKHPTLILGKRLRLALQELGPVWIKFGQMLSTRHDIFSDETIHQLTMLQDQVAPFDGNIAKTQIENSLGYSLDIYFKDFQKTPLASASIAQVHAAKFKKNNKDVIIKVIRPNIVSIIQIDIRCMYKISAWIYKLLPEKRKFQFSKIIYEYEKTLFNELNLLKETANTIQLKRNFKNSNILYVPKVYVEFCRTNIMVAERIYGIPIYNLTTLKKYNVNMKLLAKRGVEIFFIQIFRDSFFHGDMHPGNIFVDVQYPNRPKYISIDCGIMGSLNYKDKYYLAANFIALFNRNYRKIAELHFNSGWIPKNINIADFEYAMRTIFEPMFEKTPKNIYFNEILLHLFNVAQNFHMEIQPQLILLQKTLLYVEEVTKKIYPNLNVWKNSKPFLEKWMQEQLKFSKIIYSVKNKIPYWSYQLPELSEILFNKLTCSDKLQKKIEILLMTLNAQRTNNVQILFLFSIGTIFIISSILGIIYNQHINKISILLFICGMIIWIISWKRII